MILPIIHVHGRGRVVKIVLQNNLAVNDANKHYKCALKVYCFELNDSFGHLSDNLKRVRP